MLCGGGVGGTYTYAVSRRRHEFGIRMAVGARPSDVLRSVIREAALLAAAGTAAGLAGSAFLTRYLQSMLYEVSAADPAVPAEAAGALGLVALAAAFLPALRATRVDPSIALRHQ